MPSNVFAQPLRQGQDEILVLFLSGVKLDIVVVVIDSYKLFLNIKCHNSFINAQDGLKMRATRRDNQFHCIVL